MSKTAIDELRERVNKAAEAYKARLEQDYEAAYVRLSEAERGADNLGEVIEKHVAEIQLERVLRERRELAKLTEVLEGAKDNAIEALAALYFNGREKGLETAQEIFDLSNFETGGLTYVEKVAREITKSYFIGLQEKYGKDKDNGQN